MFCFLNDTATSKIYALSLHDALPIFPHRSEERRHDRGDRFGEERSPRTSDDERPQHGWEDRKSTRLNSSHRCISYAVFCLKKKNESTTGLNFSFLLA